ncbi:EamA-like transporter family-domain-containing protein [Trametes elegans]|nr:EamA-like transporter family-domain-containing protein [Trametes elegans]
MASASTTPYRHEPTPDRADYPDRDVALASVPSQSSTTSSTYPPTSVTPLDTNFDAPTLQDDGPGLAQRHGAWRGVLRAIVPQKVREVAKNNTGMLLVGAAQFFFAFMNVCVKKLNNLAAVPALELICVRMGITWICCVAYMYIRKIPDPFLGPKEVRLLLVLRGCFGFVGIFSLYYSLQYLSLSDATVLQFLAPIFTAVAGAVLLHEPFSWRQAAAGLASLVGVVLIARPAFIFGRLEEDYDADPVPGATPDALVERAAGEGGATHAQRLLAVCVALVGTLGATGAYTTIRAIGKRAHALHNLVSYSTQCVVVTTIAMLALRTPVVVPTQWEWLAMLLLVGLFGFTAQTLLTAGLQRETASRGTMAIYAQIVFAALDELVFFHTKPSLLSVLGTAIILTSAIYVALTKQKVQLKAQANGLTASEDASLEEGLLENQEGIHEDAALHAKRPESARTEQSQ